MTQIDENFKCEKCGHTKSKTGKIGTTGYDKVKKIGSIMSLGTGMFISCCASCGDVYSLKIENPDKL
ncbi:hypothetical protein ACFPYN_03690 [Paenisporosarcina macmurdoensis]|jgi:hypothetical protein|uniref:Transcription initiation factor TFIIIB n=1 Tax=Paenisporosarcina macmurdoensis TaxID=212659 RepID=A0ABW1L601_9BACL